MTIEQLKANIRVIEDFPKPGIHFQDVTTLFMNPECLKDLSDRLYELYKDKGITKVVGLESRGFIMGSVIAERLGAGFVPARKKGKLPGEKISETYELEYGTDTIELHTGCIDENDVVLIHDDLLATGGTMAAASRLISHFHPKKILLNAIIELTGCPKLTVFPTDLELETIIKIDEA
jgi:adenine phosphoribosyltransferase